MNDCLGGWTNKLASPTTAIFHFEGTTWAATNWPTTFTPKSISCPSATTCIVVGQSSASSVAQKWNGSPFTATTLPVTTIAATGVSCSSTTFCMAVGNDKVGTGGPWAAKWTGGAAWTTVATSNLTASLDRVSCLSTILCYASVSPSYLFQLATWTGTPNRCFGVQGNTESRSSSITGLITASAGLGMPGSARVRDISCATATNCLALGLDSGGSHAAWHFDGTSWTSDTLDLPISADPVISRVSCPTSTFCMAIGTYAHGTRRRAHVLVWDGTTWAAPPTPLPVESNELVGARDTDVTCLSATFCAATVLTEDDVPEFPTSSTTMYVWNGSTWTPQPGAAPVHLACFSTTSCIGLDRGASYAWNGTTITRTSVPSSPGEISRLSCATPTRCVAVVYHQYDTLYANGLVSWDGTTVTQVAAPAPAGQAAAINDVSCVGTTPTRCVAVGVVGPLYETTATAGSPYVATGDGTGTWIAATLPADGPGTLRSVSCADTAECLAVGTGSVSGTAHPRLVLAMAINTWTVAPDLPSGPAGPAGLVQYDRMACVPSFCNVIGTTGPDRARDAVATSYRWTYS